MPGKHFTVAKLGRCFHKACDGRVMCMQMDTLLIEVDLIILYMYILLIMMTIHLVHLMSL